MGAVAVIGSATIDRVVQDGVVAYKRGGVVAYAGLTFAELGVETRVLTNVAEADRAMLAVLQQRGIAVYVGESAATTCFVNYVDGDARRQELLAHAAPIAAVQLGPVLAGVEHVHLGPLHPRDLAEDVLAAIDGVVSLDIQGYVRRIEGTQVYQGVANGLYAALQRADSVKTSNDELELVLADCGLTLDQLMRDCSVTEWVVTEGSHGGWVASGEGCSGRSLRRLRWRWSLIPRGLETCFSLRIWRIGCTEGRGLPRLLSALRRWLRGKWGAVLLMGRRCVWRRGEVYIDDRLTGTNSGNTKSIYYEERVRLLEVHPESLRKAF